MPIARTAVLARLVLLAATLALAARAAAQTPARAEAVEPEAPFIIRIIDDATNRGVPLVKLTTTNGIALYTDSAGVIAFDEPGLMGSKVWFSIESPGYEHPADGFGNRGRGLTTEPGGSVTIPIKRSQMAERLYRLTGQGIYHHSTRAGLPNPLGEGGGGGANLNGRVMGQDSAIVLPHAGKLFWFWGDTARPEYPLGHFGTAYATSPLPGEPGCEPATAIELMYLVDESGFSRPVFDLGRPGVVWMGGAVELPSSDGASLRIIAAYSRLKGLGELLEHGIAAFNDDTQMMEIIATFPLNAPLLPSGHTVRHTDDGADYVYFTSPYALTRVPATWEAFIDPEQYEGFTPLISGTRTLDFNAPQIERDSEGRPVYAWKNNTAIVSPQDQRKLMEAGHLSRDHAHIQTVDAADDQPIILHGGSIRYNEYRDAWIMIATRIFDDESLLGEIYYAEAPSIHGPWLRAIKVATHPAYSFYNPVHHAFFDEDDGRIIYFEGTYTMMFSSTKVPTPRYDYNQLMYRVDLADERITSVFD